MWDLFTIYVKVEGNKSIAKKGGMSFDFEMDVWAGQSSTPRLDDVLVQYQFPVVRPGAPPCSYSVAYALDVRSPDSMRHTARSTDRCALRLLSLHRWSRCFQSGARFEALTGVRSKNAA